MKKKLLGIFVCMLLISTVLPATGTLNEKTITSAGAIELVPVLDFELNPLFTVGYISVDLVNYGDGPAIDIEWEMNILIGGLFLPQTANGSFDEIGSEGYEEIRVPMLGLGLATFEFYCKYSILNITGSEIEVKQEWRDFAIIILHTFIFFQPVKEWQAIDPDDVHYFNETDQDGVEFFVEGINNMHNVRVMEGADDGSEEAEFLAACKFTNGNATLYEYGLTRDIVEGGYAHWEIEIVDEK